MSSYTDADVIRREDLSPGASSQRTHRRRIVNISALTAVASLIVALIFSAIQAHDTASQARDTRIATELQLLTQLNGLVTQSQTTVDPLSSEFLRAESGSYQLPKAINTAFNATLKNMNYLAWLFNSGFITVPGARQLWQRSMDCQYTTAILVYGSRVRGLLRDLERFVQPGHGRQVTHLRDATCG